MTRARPVPERRVCVLRLDRRPRGGADHREHGRRRKRHTPSLLLPATTAVPTRPDNRTRTPSDFVGACRDGRHPSWLGYQDSNLN